MSRSNIVVQQLLRDGLVDVDERVVQADLLTTTVSKKRKQYCYLHVLALTKNQSLGFLVATMRGWASGKKYVLIFKAYIQSAD
jgi:hypothetical protein